MSEIKLNLTDAQHTISGTIHGSVADACIAALSAEPETITELEAALARYNKPAGDISPFAWSRKDPEIDKESWDAGIVIIDLAARIVASESTHSQPGPQGEVPFHDGVCATDTLIYYRLPDDWLFLDSIDQYDGLRDPRRLERLSTPPLDARAILYGRPLLEFIVRESWLPNHQTAAASYCNTSVEVERSLTAHVGEPALAGTAGVLSTVANTLGGQTLVADNSGSTSVGEVENQASDNPDPDDTLRQQISLLHARWLMTPRDDLRGQSPRDVLLARQDFIDYDLHTRSMQWSMQGEGPPCLATDSFAYRFAGFGTHEWVIYYDLVRHLLWNARKEERGRLGEGEPRRNPPSELEQEIARLEKLKTEWLEQPQEEYGGRIPALLIENERIRLPIAMRGHDMVIDDDCPVCQMMANDAELGMEVGFWHLDGSHMDDGFAFSELRTRDEWVARRREWEDFTEKFNREWEERQLGECLASVDPVETSVEEHLDILS
ncbi:MAG: hypothetical protein M3Q91_02480 [Acidobacteriota bacterium]|nr:hypothetical protein [Acidobacteriota bacterium]